MELSFLPLTHKFYSISYLNNHNKIVPFPCSVPSKLVYYLTIDIILKYLIYLTVFVFPEILAKTRRVMALSCKCSKEQSELQSDSFEVEGRRLVLRFLTAAAAASGLNNCDIASAISTSRRALRSSKIPESEFKTLPNGLKYYDIKVGGGAVAKKGARVAVHYVAKWKGITFMTSRQGLGVGGGTPYGFDIGSSDSGYVLKGLDEGVEGMKVGGQRVLLIPPELAYGNKGVQEIPPNATIEMDVELLSIKQSPFGTAVKIVEG